MNETDEQCLDAAMGADDCTGELHTYFSALGTPIKRCRGHFEKAEAAKARTAERYPDSPVPPAWFDETESGERWNDDY